MGRREADVVAGDAGAGFADDPERWDRAAFGPGVFFEGEYDGAMRMRRFRHREAALEAHPPSKQIFSAVPRRFRREVKDDGIGGFVRDRDVVENQIFPKQILYLRVEFRVAVDFQTLLLAEDDAVGEHLSLRGEERRRTAGARRELPDVVRDEAVQEGRAILAGEEDRATRAEVEEEGSPEHEGFSHRTGARGLRPRNVRQCADVTEVS